VARYGHARQAGHLADEAAKPVKMVVAFRQACVYIPSHRMTFAVGN